MQAHFVPVQRAGGLKASGIRLFIRGWLVDSDFRGECGHDEENSEAIQLVSFAGSLRQGADVIEAGWPFKPRQDGGRVAPSGN